VRFALVAPLIVFAACATEAARPGRLTARPRAQVSGAGERGELPIGSGEKRDGRIYVPKQARDKYPLMLLLHGATGAGERIERRLQSLADDFGFIIVAPDSRDYTWDVTRGSLGPDVAFIDKTLQNVFARYPVDASHVAIAGFSDGASYALTIGVINGDLFTHVIAFSPGFIATRYGYGRPAMFISHGKSDEILPVERTQKMLVPGLRQNGYRVTYRQFDGPHTIQPEVAREACGWWLNGASPRDAAE